QVGLERGEVQRALASEDAALRRGVAILLGICNPKILEQVFQDKKFTVQDKLLVLARVSAQTDHFPPPLKLIKDLLRAGRGTSEIEKLSQALMRRDLAFFLSFGGEQFISREKPENMALLRTQGPAGLEEIAETVEDWDTSKRKRYLQA